MKNIENTVVAKTKMHRLTSKRIMFFSFILLVILVATECKKQDATIPENKVQCGTTALNETDDLNAQFKGLNLKTAQQLLEARTASAKYQDINKAFKDGYEDINVVLPNMGYHFMKSRFVDSAFDPTRPELLVYNKKADGSFELGAVEYAVPISLTPNAPPKGFAGSADVWDHNTAFGLWTLHAWVWKFNPDGVFSPMNSRVHVR